MHKKYFLIITLFLPAVSSAQNVFGKTRGLLGGVKGIIEILIPIAFGLAILFFFWGIAKFIFSAGTSKDEGKKIMVWGVVAIFVISAIWGIVAFISNTFGIDNSASFNVPGIGRPSGGSSDDCNYVEGGECN